MKIDGGCFCGFITYEAEIDPENVFVCHCTDCQSLSGSAFRTLGLAHKGSFSLRSGVPTVYVKTGEGGAKRELYFCPVCGTPISSSAVSDDPKVHAIRVGTIRQRGQLTPRSQIWFRSAQGWLARLDSIPAFQTRKSFPEDE